MDQDPTPARARRSDMLRGLAIILLAFLGCLGLSLWAKRESLPEKPRLPEPPTTMELRGFPDAIRPFEVFARAQGMTPRTQFRGFVAEGVLPDGTLDFKKKGTRLRYVFQSEPGMGPQPEREGGTLPRRAYCGKQIVAVGPKGIALEKDVTDMPCGRSDPSDLELPNGCTMEGVWQTAKKRKVKAQTARIEYYEARKGAAYRFSAGRDTFSVSAKDCTKILKGKDERGNVPD